MSYVLMDNKEPVARKEHRCIWCNEKIEVGERYRREKSIYDGHWQDHKWHLECDKAAAEYFRTSFDDTFDPGDNERPPERLGFTTDQATNE